MGNKYDDWLARKEIPEKVSLLELAVVGRRLGINVDVIMRKHYNAEFAELCSKVKAKLSKLK